MQLGWWGILFTPALKVILFVAFFINRGKYIVCCLLYLCLLKWMIGLHPVGTRQQKKIQGYLSAQWLSLFSVPLWCSWNDLAELWSPCYENQNNKLKEAIRGCHLTHARIVHQKYFLQGFPHMDQFMMDRHIMNTLRHKLILCFFSPTRF